MPGQRSLVVIALLLIILLAVAAYLMHRPQEVVHMKPSISVWRISAREVRLYSLLEVDLNVTAEYENPFNPEEINVTAIVTSPSGRVIAVPAFYYQEYTRRLVGSREVLEVVGKPYWKIRFTPTEVGEYSFYVEVRDRWGNTAKTDAYTFRVLPSSHPGFVRVSDEDHRYLEFDNGLSAFFVGHDVCWASSRGTFDYDEWFAAMQESGENLTRIWMAPWCFGIEWRGGAGRYDLAEAWKLDYVLKLAEERGIYVILCFMNHGQLRREEQWSENPYNKANGGPLDRPEDFWTSEEALKLLKRRLRYIVARWGYSTHILAWELWNEVDLTDGYREARAQVVKWHKEMAEYIKEIDPYNHLVTTSFANPDLDPEVWALREIDIVTVHRYGPQGFRDVAGSICKLIVDKWKRYSKPVIVTEFGVDWRWWGEPYYYEDREGVGLHNGLWSAVMAGSPATAMSWWWDNYIQPYDLYYHFRAIANYLKGLHPAESNLSYLRAKVVIPEDLSREDLADLTLYPSIGWARPSESYFTICLNGSVEGDLSQLSAFIQGRAHPELRNNPTFRATFPHGGRVVIHVNSVARGGATLALYVDGVLMRRLDLPDRDGRNDGYTGEYDEDVRVEVPPGTHEIRVDNVGNDWFTWDYIRFEGVIAKQARARIIGLTNGTLVLAWVQNRDHTWWNMINNVSVEPVKDLEIVLHELEDGNYLVEIWDTYRGVIVEKQEAKAVNGSLVIKIRKVESDVALKVYRVGD